MQTEHLTSLENVPIMDDIATLKKMIKHIHIQIAPQLVSKSSRTSKHGDYKSLLDVILFGGNQKKNTCPINR